MLRQLSTTIYNYLNVTAVTSKALGGVYPLVAEQEVKNFITYSFDNPSEITKSGYYEFQVNISCYSAGYNKSLEMLDEVIKVMKSANARMLSLSSEYLDETNECVAAATFNIKLTINTQ